MNPVSNTRPTAGSIATGAAAGVAAGAATGAAMGALSGEDGARLGSAVGAGVGGALGAALAVVSPGDSKAAAHRAASAIFEATAAGFGSAASLGTAFSMQNLLTSEVSRYIELNNGGAPLTAAQRVAIRACFDGPAWLAVSPAVGLQAAAVGTLFNLARNGINAAFKSCGFTPPLQRPASPGYGVTSMDMLAICITIGASIRGAQGTDAAFNRHPLVTTVTSSIDGAGLPDGVPATLVTGMASAIAVALAMVGTGLAERNNGGLKFGPAPDFGWKEARNMAVSRMIDMSRSGFAHAGPIWGPMMWGVRDLLVLPGGVLDQLGLPTRAIDVAAFGLTAATIGPMANLWFEQIRANDGGAPGEPPLAAMHQGATAAGIPVQRERLAHEMRGALTERSAAGDGSLGVAVLRNSVESLGVVLLVGSAFAAVTGPGEVFAAPDDFINECRDVSLGAGLGAMTVAAALQYVGMRVASSLGRQDQPSGPQAVPGAASAPWLDRSDPQAMRAISNVGNMGLGATAVLLGAIPGLTGIVPAVAFGAAVGGTANLVHEYLATSNGGSRYPATERQMPPPAVNPRAIPGLIATMAETVRDVIYGRPGRPVPQQPAPQQPVEQQPGPQPGVRSVGLRDADQEGHDLELALRGDQSSSPSASAENSFVRGSGNDSDGDDATGNVTVTIKMKTEAERMPQPPPDVSG